MGSIKQRGKEQISPSPGNQPSGSTTRSKNRATIENKVAPDPVVLDLQKWLQKWLQSMGLIRNPNLVNGIYSESTHMALENLYASASVRGEEFYLRLSEVLDKYLQGNTVASVARNPAVVRDLLIQIQYLTQNPPSKQPDEQDTPYIKVNISGIDRMLPIALIWNRGYRMYQAILEQEGLLDMSQPLAQRVAALNEATRAILAAIRAQYPNNVNLQTMMTIASQKLSEEWEGASRAPGAPGTAGTLVDAINSWSETSAFRRLPDGEKARIISAIYYSFPHADSFMEAPPNINSKITDIAEMRRNRASIIAIVQAHLRDMGYRI